jgi:PIN domain nuclease of toxin-antitoxin system
MGSPPVMRLLLDTHILLWALLEPARLSKRVATALQDPANELWVSPISTWEMILLAEKGRIILEPDPVTWIRKVYRTIAFQEAVLNHEVAIQSRSVDLPYQDPADRFLIASAQVYDLTLVTADDRLLHFKQASILPNR